MDTAEQYEQQERAARSRDDRPLLGHALRHLSEILLGRSEPEAALRKADEAVELYRALQPARPLDLANALRLRALALGGGGRADMALTAWREARSLYQAEGVAEGVAECDVHLTDLSG